MNECIYGDICTCVLCAETITHDKFAVTSLIGDVYNCEGCCGFADSFSASTLSTQRGCCVHTASFPTVHRVFSGEENSSSFAQFVKVELDCNETIIKLKEWNKHARYLVFLPTRIALCENISRYSVCSVFKKDDEKVHRLYCNHVRCKRGKNKKVKNARVDAAQVCCHLKQLLHVIFDNDTADANDSISCAEVEDMAINTGISSTTPQNMNCLLWTLTFLCCYCMDLSHRVRVCLRLHRF